MHDLYIHYRIVNKVCFYTVTLLTQVGSIARFSWHHSECVVGLQGVNQHILWIYFHWHVEVFDSSLRAAARVALSHGVEINHTLH